MKPLFCPNCHVKINIPKMFLQNNIKAEKGINLQCGNCGKGKVKFYPPVKEDPNNSSL